MITTMALRVAAGIWLLYAFVLGATAINELLQGDWPSMVLGLGISAASGWVGYRLLRGFTREIAVAAASFAAFLTLLIVVVIVQGNIDLFPIGIIAMVLTGLAGILPYRERRRL